MKDVGDFWPHQQLIYMLLLFLDWKKSPKDKSQLPRKQIHYLLETEMCLLEQPDCSCSGLVNIKGQLYAHFLKLLFTSLTQEKAGAELYEVELFPQVRKINFQ